MSVSSLMNTYGSRTTTLVKGQGAYVWDQSGKRYIDAISGIAVCGLGHCHPAVTQAITDQANTLVHCSNLYLIEPQIILGEQLTKISGLEKVFFSNSGAEANEAAIKIARKFGQSKGIEKPEIISTTKSFHGRTMATLSATGNPKVKEGFFPLVEGFAHAEYNSIESIKSVATSNTVALMVEPVQGEGGVNVPDPSYLSELRKLCDEQDWLLILDEIQTGNGRSGKYFAFQHTDMKPDVLTTAKGLANGVPIGACLTGPKAAHILQPGNHGSTFGGNPLACAAANAVVRTINTPEFLTRVNTIANLMVTQFNKQLEHSEKVVQVRNLGLLIGIELNIDCSNLVEQGKELGVLINVAGGNTIRLLPPLNITDDEAQTIVDAVVTLIQNS
ncbi:aspartate aminotransferase family protein [Teredinibacter sp. KSP-S5-2]|uniref:aspartate aminotransferase family protein n=1 Tax=Teredinibacter sp. KSP-S5-2 TaxID=3034506 RepID=UPI00293492E6|nr:aspartate aminotransferase family protein [Teredinibacter sp. KSP-S5-2]WNO10168.1 aspartate aminotransferase family protein [Teredinibacter sp. KSP-S5-2]